LLVFKALIASGKWGRLALKILVIGATGLIGSAMLRVLSERSAWQVFGTVRSDKAKKLFLPDIATRLIFNVDVEQHDSLICAINKIRPDVVINCAGLTKHKSEADDPLRAIPLNSLMPHRLAGICKLLGARLIHVSTDCVFSGDKGNYTEDDYSDARDIYGKSKALGDLTYPNTVTLRTSTIGHELETRYGLLEWFLLQERSCKGFSRAIFSGLPTVVFAELVRDIVIPKAELSGLYHVAAQPISKFDLLTLIASVYDKQIEITPDKTLVIDRSLNSERFRAATGYIAPNWPTLIKIMHSYS
jgi:dTDP-4-dehydrorhamnose reductase